MSDSGWEGADSGAYHGGGCQEVMGAFGGVRADGGGVGRWEIEGVGVVNGVVLVLTLVLVMVPTV